MHYYALVIAPGDADVNTAVERAMAPHEETWDEATEESSGHWDWWSVGGRWTGVLDPTYDPREDPANIEVCDLCGGTGDRAAHRGEPKHIQAPSGCNGCDGTGRALKWPTQWAEGRGNVAKAADVLAMNGDAPLPYALVTPDGTFHVKETWNGDGFDKTPDWDDQVRALLAEHADDRVIVVDYHT